MNAPIQLIANSTRLSSSLQKLVNTPESTDLTRTNSASFKEQIAISKKCIDSASSPNSGMWLVSYTKNEDVEEGDKETADEKIGTFSINWINSQGEKEEYCGLVNYHIVNLKSRDEIEKIYPLSNKYLIRYPEDLPTPEKFPAYLYLTLPYSDGTQAYPAPRFDWRSERLSVGTEVTVYDFLIAIVRMDEENENIYIEQVENAPLNCYWFNKKNKDGKDDDDDDDGSEGGGVTVVGNTGYSGEFALVLSGSETDEEGTFTSLSLRVQNNLISNASYAGRVMLGGTLLAKAPKWSRTVSPTADTPLKALYVWLKLELANSEVRCGYEVNNSDEPPKNKETKYGFPYYELIGSIQDGSVRQAHYGPVVITDRYYDVQVNEEQS